MHRASTRALVATVTGSLFLAGALVIPSTSGASGVSFCHEALAVSSVPSPTLPSSDSLDAISAALAKLSGDLGALRKGRAAFAAAAADAPDAELATLLRAAATAAGSESANIERVENEATVVLLAPDSPSAITALAHDVIAAAEDAATVNAYLDVERTQVASFCR